MSKLYTIELLGLRIVLLLWANIKELEIPPVGPVAPVVPIAPVAPVGPVAPVSEKSLLGISVVTVQVRIAFLQEIVKTAVLVNVSMGTKTFALVVVYVWVNVREQHGAIEIQS